MKNDKTNRIATHIGNDVTAVGNQPAASTSYTIHPRIELMTTSGTDDGAFIPAQSIMIHGKDAVTQLRDFCNLILEPMKEQSNGNNPTA